VEDTDAFLDDLPSVPPYLSYGESTRYADSHDALSTDSNKPQVPAAEGPIVSLGSHSEQSSTLVSEVKSAAQRILSSDDEGEYGTGSNDSDGSKSTDVVSKKYGGLCITSRKRQRVESKVDTAEQNGAIELRPLEGS
jgi:hypothetical protein